MSRFSNGGFENGEPTTKLDLELDFPPMPKHTSTVISEKISKEASPAPSAVSSVSEESVCSIRKLKPKKKTRHHIKTVVTRFPTTCYKRREDGPEISNQLCWVPYKFWVLAKKTEVKVDDVLEFEDGSVWYHIFHPRKGWIDSKATLEKIRTTQECWCWDRCDDSPDNQKWYVSAGTLLGVNKTKTFDDGAVWYHIVFPYKGWLDAAATKVASKQRTMHQIGYIGEEFKMAHEVEQPAENSSLPETGHSFGDVVAYNGQKAVIAATNPLMVRVNGAVITVNSSDQISEVETQTLVVIVAEGIVRVNPNARAFKLGTLKYMTRVEVVDRKGHFAQITSPMTGWIRYRTDDRVELLEVSYQPEMTNPSIVVDNIPLSADDVALKKELKECLEAADKKINLRSCRMLLKIRNDRTVSALLTFTHSDYTAKQILKCSRQQGYVLKRNQLHFDFYSGYMKFISCPKKWQTETRC